MEAVFLFPNIGAKDWTQIVRLGCKGFNQLSHMTDILDSLVSSSLESAPVSKNQVEINSGQ